MSSLSAGEDRVARLLPELRKVKVFEDLPPEDLTWFIEESEERHAEAGQILSHEGDPADTMQVILRGRMEARKESSPSELPTYIAEAGMVTGALPFSRLTHYPRASWAATPMHYLMFPISKFDQLHRRMPVLTQRLVGVMSDRIRETTRVDFQQEKLISLGRLSAGLAHEMNNPAAAIKRASGALKETLDRQAAAALRLASAGLTPAQLNVVAELECETMTRACTLPQQLSSLELSEREDELAAWIETRDVRDGWRVASALVEAGWTKELIEKISGDLQGERLCDVLTHAAATVQAHRLAGEIEASASRISDLVLSIKQYSFMDQGPDSEIDIHSGIESTITMLWHRLKNGIEVIREFDRGLPKVPAHGSELNQVWTNLIDNAVDAMNGQGELRIRTQRDLERVMVEITDNGRGIPPEVRRRIFEPFFTSKPVGQGTGLGLGTVHRIVRKHGGEVRFDSQAGRTSFQVFLPIQRNVVGSSGEHRQEQAEN